MADSDIPNLEAQLQTLRIPKFTIPWAEACSPDVEAVEAQMLKWAESYGLFANEAYRDRVVRTRYAWLAARCYPKAKVELLQALADYFVWFFLVDDLFVDRVETVTPQTLRNLTSMIDILDFDEAQPSPVFSELAWLDVCRRLRKLLSPEQFERFAQGMRLWATTAGLQILNHMRDQSVGIREYETIRRHTSGMNPCLAVADAANAGSISSDAFYSREVQELYRHANNIVCWSNDVQSLIVEARQPGQFRNMALIYAIEGRTLQEAVDKTAERVQEEIQSFMTLSETILAKADTRMAGLVEGFKFWIRGYNDWVLLDTKRYADEFAADDADDRSILLATNDAVVAAY